MSSPVFHASADENETGVGRITLHGDETQDLTKSPWIESWDNILVGDGMGTKFKATTTSVTPDEIPARIDSRVKLEREVPALTLVQAGSKLKHMCEAVNRAAETGTERVVPYMSPRSPTPSSGKPESRMEICRRIAREVSKVAKRVWHLEVDEMEEWPPEISALSHRELNIVLWEEGRLQNLVEALHKRTPATTGILVGPEGGFSEVEVQSLKKLGCVKAGMGGLILRIETVGYCCLMLVRHHHGILSPGGA